MEVSANFLSRPDDIATIKEACSKRLEGLGAALVIPSGNTTHAPPGSPFVPVRVRIDERVFVSNIEELNEIFNQISEIVRNEPVMRRSFLQSVADGAVHIVALPDGTCPRPLKNSRHEEGKIRASYWLTSGVLIRAAVGDDARGGARIDVTYIRAYRGGVGVQHLASGHCDSMKSALRTIDSKAVEKMGGLAKFERAVLAATALLAGMVGVAEW